MTKSRGILPPRQKWTDEQVRILRERYPHEQMENLVEVIGRDASSIYWKARALGIRKSVEYLASPAACRLRRGDNIGAEHRFQKGAAPWNKNKKGINMGESATRFSQGHKPHNTLPIGSHKYDKDGTLLRKVSDASGNNSKRWRAVHELVWVEANGPVPHKHIVVFKSGMRTNVLEEITVERVECISLAENMRRNTRHNLPKEINEVIQLRAVLTRHINKRSKANEQENH